MPDYKAIKCPFERVGWGSILSLLMQVYGSFAYNGVMERVSA